MMRCDFRPGPCAAPPTHWYDATCGRVPICADHAALLLDIWPAAPILPMGGE